jgi:hypothetical protein
MPHQITAMTTGTVERGKGGKPKVCLISVRRNSCGKTSQSRLTSSAVGGYLKVSQNEKRGSISKGIV